MKTTRPIAKIRINLRHALVRRNALELKAEQAHESARVARVSAHRAHREVLALERELKAAHP